MSNTQKLTARQVPAVVGGGVWGIITGTLSDQTDLWDTLLGLETEGGDGITKDGNAFKWGGALGSTFLDGHVTVNFGSNTPLSEYIIQSDDIQLTGVIDFIPKNGGNSSGFDADGKFTFSNDIKVSGALQVNDGSASFGKVFSALNSFGNGTWDTIPNLLGYTPYDAVNPSGFISAINGSMVIGALGYTPYDAANPSGYITPSSASALTNKTGNVSQWTNDSGYISSITSGNVTTALGYTPVNPTRTISTTSPITGGGNLSADRTFAFDFSVANIFSAAQTIQQNNSGASQPVGITFINNTAATVSLNQNPGYINMAGNAWKTNATAGSQPWAVNLVANAVTGTANALPQFVIGTSANGVGLINWLTLTSTAVTIQSLGTLVLSNNGGQHMNCSGNRTIFQNAQVWVNNKLAAGNSGAFDPTAKVHIGAGTITAQSAPLKFTAGSNMTTPEVGSIEYDGVSLFFTRSGTTRESILTAVANVVSPTAPNRTLSVVVGGTTYYIAAKTTND